jgi:hypothetical protein
MNEIKEGQGKGKRKKMEAGEIQQSSRPGLGALSPSQQQTICGREAAPETQQPAGQGI